MLEIKNISKSYKIGDFTQKALDDISLKFRKNEFVSILGTSGSGKTTFLNIVGGLDKYDSGDLIINGVSTKEYKDSSWDTYRNNCIGFIFQSYNLITHISILNNVEMSLTLSGVSKKTRRKKAIEVLKKVGLKDHMHKKPNQLSGGQMQRVAIARALVNNPDIILADEPTGALDSKTSKDIMELIKEVAKEKLVIMVTHNEELAKEYSTRIVTLKDGKITSDSNPYENEETKDDYKFKKTAMSFLTALKLSLNNIFTKKGRTLLTAFASSIGIIGISLILALSNGFDIQIDKFESDTLSSFPILISRQAAEIDMEELAKEQEKLNNQKIDDKKVYSYSIEEETIIHNNIFTEEYLNYIKNIDKKLVYGISYTRFTGLNALIKNNGNISIVDTSSFIALPTKTESDETYLEKGYDLLEGTLPENKNEIVVELDYRNRLDKNILKMFGIEDKEINIEKLLGKEIKIILNDDYYKETNGFFMMNTSLEEMYKSKNAITLKVVGVIRAKSDNALSNAEASFTTTTTGRILYTNDLIEYVIEKNSTSKIVKEQQKQNYNVLTMQDLTEEEKEQMLLYFGAKDVPYAISIYPNNFDDKEQVLNYLDKYNENKEDENKVVYTDMAQTMVSLSGGIMDAITYVLIAFSAISLVVSGIMIGIITYISVLERTKEIGILRSLGARKKDIRRVFNAETFIIGLTSGLMGILIARLLIFPVNSILKNLTDLDNVAQMNIKHVIIMLIISIVITLIGGSIPAKIASKKDPVEALRTE